MRTLDGINRRDMNQSTENIEGADFKPSRSDLLSEIKEQIIVLNENLTNGETELRFGRAASQGVPQPLAEVYRALSQLVKLTREILTPTLLEECEHWLDVSSHLDDKVDFLLNARDHSRCVQEELFNIGIKDTNVIRPVAFPMTYYLDMMEVD